MPFGANVALGRLWGGFAEAWEALGDSGRLWGRLWGGFGRLGGALGAVGGVFGKSLGGFGELKRVGEVISQTRTKPSDAKGSQAKMSAPIYLSHRGVGEALGDSRTLWGTLGEPLGGLWEALGSLSALGR